MMPLPRRVRQQARIEGLNPDVWDEDGYVVIDADINKAAFALNRSTARRTDCGSSRRSRAPPPNNGIARWRKRGVI
jgi:hypothetical protein